MVPLMRVSNAMTGTTLVVCDACAFTDNFVSAWQIPADDLTLELPLREKHTDDTDLYNFTVDWGDGTTDEVTSFDDVDKTHTYAEAGEYTVVISGLMEGWYAS